MQTLQTGGRKGNNSCCRLEITVSGPWSDVEVREEQLKDEDLAPIVCWKEDGQCPEWEQISEKGAATKSYWTQWDSITEL